MIERKRRLAAVIVAALMVVLGLLVPEFAEPNDQNAEELQNYPEITESVTTSPALEALAELEVKGRAPKTGYDRAQFGAGWAHVEGCDMRNFILERDMSDVALSEDGCTVMSGVLRDPYTGETIRFTRGQSSSSAVQIDHVVALSDAWQKGAQQLDEAERAQFANDPLNLLAVDGPANMQKSDSDAASWLPPNKSYRCRFVARQIAVKQEYSLWITRAERDAMQRVLSACPDQVLPVQVMN